MTYLKFGPLPTEPVTQCSAVIRRTLQQCLKSPVVRHWQIGCRNEHIWYEGACAECVDEFSRMISGPNAVCTSCGPLQSPILTREVTV